jgi:hypothetical protein
MRPFLTRLTLATMLSLPLPLFAQGVPGCDMNELARLPVTFHGEARRAAIPGTFDDQPALVLLDFGKNESTLNKDGLKKLGIPMSSSSTTVPGIDLQTGHIKKLVVGQNATKGWFTVLDASGDEIAMHAGAAFLLKNDIEIALADQYVKFFKPAGCRKASLAYWDPKAYVVPIEGDSAGVERRVWIKVSVNGRQINALLSPSTPVSYMDSIAAARMGMSGDTPGAVELEPVKSWRGAMQRVWDVPAKSIQIGGYTISDTRLQVLNMTLSGEMLVLGADFLRKHRVLISSGQRKLYFTPSAAPGATPAI